MPPRPGLLRVMMPLPGFPSTPRLHASTQPLMRRDIVMQVPGDVLRCSGSVGGFCMGAALLQRGNRSAEEIHANPSKCIIPRVRRKYNQRTSSATLSVSPLGRWGTHWEERQGGGGGRA